MNDELDRLRGRDEGNVPLEEPLPTHTPDNRYAWMGFAALVVVVAVGLWLWAPRSSRSPAEAVGRVPVDDAITEPVAEAPRGLGVGAPDPNLPPLGALDGYVRPLLAALSKRPELAALLATDGLVRRFVVSVEAIARGATPARQVNAIAPKQPFSVQQRDGRMVAAPASYARYAGLVSLVDDVDPDQLARLYGQLKPRLEEAYAELGVPGTFDERITAAIAHLLATPIPAGDVEVLPGKGTNYVYADRTLEGLSAAQRQLLRLGPDGARKVQGKLRAFGVALGIPPGQLPGS